MQIPNAFPELVSQWTISMKHNLGFGLALGSLYLTDFLYMSYLFWVEFNAHYENKLTKNIRPAKIWQIYTNFEQIY